MLSGPATQDEPSVGPVDKVASVTEDCRPPVPDDLDVVVFGATGFVGRLTAEHLASHAPEGTRIGLAGRSADRLRALRTDLGERAAEWPLLVADVEDEQSLVELARTTKVVATTVGPYARYGLPLVRACAAAGTHYADLNGEVLFVRRAIDAAHETALASGARIVTSCGFDSVPSDLGVLLAHTHAQATGAGELTVTTLTLVSARGGLSGGTVDSLRTQVDEARGDPAAARLLSDPYSLSPDRDAEPELGPQPDKTRVHRDPKGRWTAPFVMAAHNTRIVRRSNALQGWAYGRSFHYTEDMSCGRSLFAPAVAAGVAVGLRAVPLGLSLAPARVLLDRVLPSPGSGPSERTRSAGHFRVQLRAETTSGRVIEVTVAAEGDPGYAATAVMLGQTALGLALDGSSLPAGAGVLTPATGLGAVLVNRLREQGFDMNVSG